MSVRKTAESQIVDLRPKVIPFVKMRLRALVLAFRSAEKCGVAIRPYLAVYHWDHRFDPFHSGLFPVRFSRGNGEFGQ